MHGDNFFVDDAGNPSILDLGLANDDPLSALMEAISKNDHVAIKLLIDAERTFPYRCSGRTTTLGSHSTGTMSVQTLGFATGKIGAARGGKELNNALIDANPDRSPDTEVLYHFVNFR